MAHAHVQFPHPTPHPRIDCKQSYYGPGALRQRHYHDDTWIVFPFTGSFALTLRSAESLLSSRSLLYLPAGEPHANVFGSHGAGVFIAAINPSWINDRLGVVTSAGEMPRIAPAGFLEGLALKLYREFQNPDALSDLIMEGALLELLGRWFREKVYADRGSPSWLRQVKALLHDSFCNPVSLNQIASVAGVHPSHVAREFHRVYGMTIGEYLRKLRIEFVAERLVYPSKDGAALTDLALSAGFSSQAHMAAVFKRMIGMTPGEYRKAHGLHQSRDRTSIS
ncbi:MAG: AraC family transcriptional regulator [Terriglobales bacterium]|jgi:AraC family transcriptional regulator